jgi:hypothetical protein
MRTTSRAWHVLLSIAVVGCGGSSEPSATGSRPGAPAGLIAAGALARCAGFTVETAAAIVGAEPAEFTDDSQTEGDLRMCRYSHAMDRSRTVSFTLSRSDSVERAAASMQSERETMGMAQGAIDRVMGSQSKDAAVEDVSGIGDEAFYWPMNDTIMLRVANVQAQVMAPADMALKKRTAEEVAQGLR